MTPYVILLSILLAVPAYAQLSTFQDNQGTFGIVMPNGPNHGMYFDNQGRQGQYQRNGSQGMWMDNRGNMGQWQDVGPRQRAFSDNQGGQGQMFDYGNGMGSFNYQNQRGTVQGQWQQFGR